MKKTTKKLNIKETKYLQDTQCISTFDLNDYNPQVNLPEDGVPADGGLKDNLNDIKILLKSMNDNLDKILHSLNGGWN